MLRVLPLILGGEDKVAFVAIRGSHAAARAQRIFDVQYRFIEGDASLDELENIAGLKVAGLVVESDPDRLEQLADRGDVDVVEAYRELLG
jgi:hypothetical protein